MKLILKDSPNLANERLTITQKEVPCLDSTWHYHAQYELLYISSSNGIRFVGDSVSHFFPGDLVLVGAYLPHLWRNDVSYYQEAETKDVNTIIIKFTKNFIGEDTFTQPEFSAINQLLDESKYGLSFGQNTSQQLHHELMKIGGLSAVEQSIKLLSLLNQLSITKDREVLSSTDMRKYTEENSQRIDTVLKFISDNYDSYITLKDVADIACLTTNSFCRFFKKMTNKSFTQFLNEVRIRNAARLLVQEDLPVSEVCYTVGYRTITNFNRQFKHIMGCTPNAYRYSM